MKNNKKIKQKVSKIMIFLNRNLKRTTQKSFERECKKHLVGETR